ncbi:MAG TPA: glutamate cyclase domain-containing protein [Acetobacteraceae bacterium]|nr:glutamate cyclase domain-containing protein [Acetobacteraceae bacterium]
MDRAALIDAVEAVVHRDVGRNIAPLFAATRGGLRDAVSAIANTPGPIGLITGFYVPGGIPPAAETDGPVATALLARALRRVGIACRICTDAPCVSACVAALAAADAIDVAIDVVPLGGDVAEAIATWRAYRVKLAIAIERCGRTKDGTARNMRGEDISAETTLLDGLFLAGPWDTAAIGDGGNEIGTGGLSRALVADCIAHGETIACVTPASHLILAGVSHWGVYALLGGLAVQRPDWRGTMVDCLDPRLDQSILESTVRNGPAVDGVTRQQTATIDSLEPAAHHQVLQAIRMLVT